MRTQRLLTMLIMLVVSSALWAHPMPHSVMLLDVKKAGIAATLQWPLKELQIVFPQDDIDSGYATLLSRKRDFLEKYLLQHFSMRDTAGRVWNVTIRNTSVTDDEQPMTGRYHELVFDLWLQPPANVSPRHFTMQYDAIMHQLVTHKMFIRIEQDWYGGLTANDSAKADVGVLSVNTYDGTVHPVVVNLDEGSTWKGVKAMIDLGIEHIAEGTDHLLFLIVLLLPAGLMVQNKRWSGFGGTAYSLLRLLKMVTAFTIGHSVSLFAAAMHWLALPQQPVEIAIACTILITAVHAIWPLFFGREVFIAAGFGLIHGLAFATVVASLNVDLWHMMLSILGFNIGIELMQLFVIICVVPWLLMLSQQKLYKWMRIGGAIAAIVASLGWMWERITQQGNVVTYMVEQTAVEAKWIVIALMLLAILTTTFSRKRM